MTLSSLVTQTVKNLPVMWETWAQSLGWENPLEKGMATHSSILAWEILTKEEPGRLQSMGSQTVRHDWATDIFTGPSCCFRWHYLIHFNGYVIFHCMYVYTYTYHIFFSQSSVDGHLGFFHVLAIVNSTIMNTGMHVSFWIMSSPYICPGMEL